MKLLSQLIYVYLSVPRNFLRLTIVREWTVELHAYILMSKVYDQKVFTFKKCT